MKLKFSKYLYLMVFGIVSITLVYSWFLTSPYFYTFNTWAHANYSLFIAILFGVKILGILIPPIPGGAFTLGAIPFLGWINACLVDFLGGTLGASVAYFAGKKWGYAILEKIFDDKAITKIKSIKVKNQRELEAVIVLRILSTGLLMEVICYGAGLLKIKYRKFLVGYALTHLILTAPSYFLADIVFNTRSFLINVFLLLITIPLMIKLKGRYFE